MNTWQVMLLGLIEGLTEFIPVSSTGHLILAEHLLGFQGMEEQMNVFEIVIQAGAIFAVCWEYRARIAKVLTGITSDRKQQRFAVNIGIAFLPLAILGLIFGNFLKTYLFKPVPVAMALICTLPKLRHFCSTRSRRRPGVATSTSTPSRISSICGLMSTPP